MRLFMKQGMRLFLGIYHKTIRSYHNSCVLLKLPQGLRPCGSKKYENSVVYFAVPNNLGYQYQITSAAGLP